MAKYLVGRWRVGPHILLKGQASPGRSSWRHQLIEKSLVTAATVGSPGPLLGPEPSLGWTKASGLQTTQWCQPPTLSHYSPHKTQLTHILCCCCCCAVTKLCPVLLSVIWAATKLICGKWVISTLGNNQNWGKGFQTRASLVTQW